MEKTLVTNAHSIGFVNFFLAERRVSGWSQKGIGTRVRYYMYLTIISLPVFLIGCSIHNFTSPCFPGNFGYWILPECRTGNTGLANTLLKLLTGLVFAWNMNFEFSHFVFEVSSLTALHCYCFIDHMEMIKWNMGRVPSREFAVFRIRKELQLLLNEYNNIHKGFLSGMSLLLIGSVQVMCLYLLIKSHDEIILPFLLVVSLLSYDCLMLFIDVDGALKSQVYQKSVELHQIATRTRTIMRSAVLRKEVNSWRVMRVYLNDVNYFERTTPLILVDFNISILISLLMMQSTN